MTLALDRTRTPEPWAHAGARPERYPAMGATALGLIAAMFPSWATPFTPSPTAREWATRRT